MNATLATRLSEFGWTKINSAQLDAMGRDPHSYDWIVMACDQYNPQCTFNMMKVPWVIAQHTSSIRLFYIDQMMNKMYLKDYVQREEIDDFKIGLFFKHQLDLWGGVPRYNNMMLDGLMRYQTAEINIFFDIFMWIGALGADPDPDTVVHESRFGIPTSVHVAIAQAERVFNDLPIW